MSIENVVIIGTGPAGYTAGIYAARAGLDPIIVTGLTVGGQLTTTNEIENWPGGGLELSAANLMADMHNHAEALNVRMEYDLVSSVDFSKSPYKLTLDSGKVIETKVVIIATGAKPKLLGLKSESEFFGKGVTTCATCDGYFYKNKPVMVVGGGNTAVEEALFLSNIASKVYLVVRKNHLKCEEILKKRLEDKMLEGKIVVYYEYVVDEILGNDFVEKARIRYTKRYSEYVDVEVDGIFVAIGHIPNTELFVDQLHLECGYIVNDKYSDYDTATSVKGVFSTGDVSDHIYRQAITSAATGCKAALDAIDYLNKK